jgi:hypothetical protein
MKRFSLMITLLLVLLFAISGPTFAQNIGEFCGDLPEADCTLLTDSQTAMMEVTSASAQFDMAFSVSNIPDAPFDSLDFSLNGDGSFAVDPALMEMMHSIQDDPSALFSNPEAFSEWFTSFLNGVSGDLNLTLNIPADLAETFSSEDMTIPQTISIGLRLVDGVGYVNLEDVAALMPDQGIPAGWMGVDLSQAWELAMQEEGFNQFSEMDPDMFQSYMGSFTDPAFLAEFMTIERVEDTEVAGQQAAVFLYTFDYGALFQSEAFQNMMQMQMEAAAEMSGEELDEDAQAEMEEAMSMMGPMFDDLNLEVREVIGLDDKYTHRTEIHMDWDMSAMMAMMEPDSDTAAPTLVFDMTITSSDFNSAPEVTAPEDATLIPLDSMMSGSSSS